MATQWHYQRDGEFRGPVGFNDLVLLVRTESLSADDLVREDWNTEWRPAALAVGLFHMAGRQDLFDRWEAEQAEKRRLEEAARAAAEEENEPSWQKRLREVEAEHAALAAELEAERQAELAANATRTEIDATLAAALDELDARERALEPTRLERLFGRAGSPAVLHVVFRGAMALTAANAVAKVILDWSQTELQRFPDRQRLESGIRVFPGWGECDPELYYFLLCDATLLAGVVAFLLARLLERTVDD